MKHIIFDLDDTLGELSIPLMHTLNKITKQDFTVADWNSFYISEMYDMTNEELFEAMIDFKLLEKMLPYADVKDVLTHLKKNHTINIVTARAWHPDGRNITEKWFAKHQIPYDNIVICDVDKSKIDCISTIDDIVLAVDDRDTHCEDFTNYGKIKKVLMMHQPWNTKESHIERIHSIKEVLNHI